GGGAAALRRGSARRLLLRLRPRDAVAGEGSARGRARLFRAALRRDTGHVAARWFHRRCRRAAQRATHGGGARARGAPRRRARRACADQGGKVLALDRRACRDFGALPLPVRGEGWGERVTEPWRDFNPSPQPSPCRSRISPTSAASNAELRVNPSSVGEGADRICRRITPAPPACPSLGGSRAP